jgi:hypothetical protein
MSISEREFRQFARPRQASMEKHLQPEPLPLKRFRNMQVSSNASVADAQVFDARGLSPPDNILAILKKVAELPPGVPLHVQLDSNPFQLYDLLQQRGYFLEMTRVESGSYIGRIRARDTAAASH